MNNPQSGSSPKFLSTNIPSQPIMALNVPTGFAIFIAKNGIDVIMKKLSRGLRAVKTSCPERTVWWAVTACRFPAGLVMRL